MVGRTLHGFFDEQFLRCLERLHLLAKRLAARAPVGARASRRLGDGLEFADHRDYAPGDDIRFLDWPYYARMEKLLLRLFHQHSEADVSILLDCSASMAPGGAGEKFDYARRAAAALAYVAMGGLERVWIFPFSNTLGEPLRTGRNRGQIVEVLEFLSTLRPSGRTALRACADRFVGALSGEARRPGPVLLLGDLLDCGDELSDSLSRLQLAGCDVTVLHVFSPHDADPRLAGPVLLRHAEQDAQLSIQATKDVLNAYRAAWKAFATTCEHACLARGATYVAAPTDAPLEQLILHAMRRAGVLGE